MVKKERVNNGGVNSNVGISTIKHNGTYFTLRMWEL